MRTNSGFPPRSHTRKELLKFILQRGGAVAYTAEMCDEMAIRCHLQSSARARVDKDGRNRWANELRWCREELVEIGYLESDGPNRKDEAIWTLTESGIEQAEEAMTFTFNGVKYSLGYR